MGAFVPILVPILKKLIIQFIVSAITSKIFGKKANKRGGGSSTSSGIMINSSGNNEPIPVSYGRQRLGGNRAFIDTSDGDGAAGTNFLNQVLILCEGEMGDIKKVYFQDKVIWDVTDGGTTDTTDVGTDGVRLQNFTTEGAEYNITHMAYYPGSNTQDVDGALQTSIGPSTWDNNRKLLGLAYLAMVLPWDADYNGSAPEITVEIAGKKIRAATNPIGSSSASADQNPADVLLDYLTDTTYGKGIPDADIDIASFADARSYMSSRFEINGFLNTNEKLFDNVEEILQACNGILTYTKSGKYKFTPRQQSESSTFSFTEDNIVGEFNIQMTPKSSKFNKVELTFNDSAKEYNDNLVIVNNGTYLTEDNNVELLGKTETTLVSDATIAGNIATWVMDNSRNQTTVEFTATHDAIDVEAGEIIDITHPVVGFTNKKFRVQQVTLTEEDTLQFLVTEYTSSIQI